MAILLLVTISGAVISTRRVKHDLERAESECERLRKLAHEAPLNPYRLDADGHRWVEQYSNAWASRSNDWVKACEKRDAKKKAITK